MPFNYKEKNPYHIDKNAHYFFETSKMYPIALYGLGIQMKSSNDPTTWVEATIVEDRYNVDDGYKLTLAAIDPLYGTESYYQCDFVSLLNKGIIIKKDEHHQRVEHFKCAELLCDNVFLIHEADFVTI